jgi:hypothetical protein
MDNISKEKTPSISSTSESHLNKDISDSHNYKNKQYNQLNKSSLQPHFPTNKNRQSNYHYSKNNGYYLVNNKPLFNANVNRNYNYYPYTNQPSYTKQNSIDTNNHNNLSVQNNQSTQRQVNHTSRIIKSPDQNQFCYSEPQSSSSQTTCCLSLPSPHNINKNDYKLQNITCSFKNKQNIMSTNNINNSNKISFGMNNHNLKPTSSTNSIISTTNTNNLNVSTIDVVDQTKVLAPLEKSNMNHSTANLNVNTQLACNDTDYQSTVSNNSNQSAFLNSNQNTGFNFENQSYQQQPQANQRLHTFSKLMSPNSCMNQNSSTSFIPYQAANLYSPPSYHNPLNQNQYQMYPQSSILYYSAYNPSTQNLLMDQNMFYHQNYETTSNSYASQQYSSSADDNSATNSNIICSTTNKQVPKSLNDNPNIEKNTFLASNNFVYSDPGDQLDEMLKHKLDLHQKQEINNNNVIQTSRYYQPTNTHNYPVNEQQAHLISNNQYNHVTNNSNLTSNIAQQPATFSPILNQHSNITNQNQQFSNYHNSIQYLLPLNVLSSTSQPLHIAMPNQQNFPLMNASSVSYLTPRPSYIQCQSMQPGPLSTPLLPSFQSPYSSQLSQQAQHYQCQVPLLQLPTISYYPQPTNCIDTAQSSQFQC